MSPPTRLVLLVEEYSMKVFLDGLLPRLFLDGLLPRLFPDLFYQLVVHEGRSDLEKSVPRKLRAWKEPGVRFVVLCDNDGRDCRAVKDQWVALCREAGRDDTLVRLACQELEAWYLGDPEALASAYDRPDLRTLGSRARFRDPDAIPQPSRALLELEETFQEVSGARRMGACLTRDCSSRSFQILLEGIERVHPVAQSVTDD